MNSNTGMLAAAAIAITGEKHAAKVRSAIEAVIPNVDEIAAPKRSWRVLELTVTDCWGIHGTRTITPEAGSITAVVGGNGSGKSTHLISGVMVALTGQTPGGSAVETCRDGAKKGSVHLKFDVSGSIYTITRSWTAGNSKSATLDRHTDGKAEKLATGVTRVNDMVQRLLGPSNFATNSWLTGQGDASKFALLEPRDRFALLAGLFNLNMFEAWQKQFHAQARELKDQELGLDGQLQAASTQTLAAGHPDFISLDDNAIAVEIQMLQDQTSLSLSRSTQEQAISATYHATCQAASSQFSAAIEQFNALNAAVHERRNIGQRLQALTTQLEAAQQQETASTAADQEHGTILGSLQEQKATLDATIFELRAEAGRLTAARETLRQGHSADCVTCGQSLPAEAHAARLAAIAVQLEMVTANGTSATATAANLDAQIAQATLAENQANIEINNSRISATEATTGIDYLRQRDSSLAHATDTALEQARQQLSQAESLQAQQFADATAVRDAAVLALPAPVPETTRLRLESLRQEQQQRILASQQIVQRQEFVQDISNRLDAAQTDRIVMDALDTAASRKGVPSSLMAGRLDDLSTTINEALAAAGSPIRVSVSLGEADTSNADKVSLYLTINDVVVPYLGASGGQRFLVDIATRLALTEMLGYETGILANQFFLDEGWGVLDKENTVTALNLLRGAVEAGRTVVTITHSDDVTAAANTVVDTHIFATPASLSTPSLDTNQFSNHDMENAFHG